MADKKHQNPAENHIQPQRLKSLLHAMIDIYSPSGKETDLLDYVKKHLRRCGARPVCQPVDDIRYNLLVVPETENGLEDIQLALVGHLDTVSAYDIEDYGYCADGDEIKGLGASDMKSGCAAMIEAFLVYQLQRRFKAPVALCLVVGEEENGDGAARLIDDYHFPWAVVGEPTDLLPCLSSYGYLEIQIASTAKRMHASVAAHHHNAIETLLHMMLQASHYLRDQHPEIVYNFRDLYSNPSGFIAPDRCEAWMDIHAPPDAPIGEIITALEEVCLQPQAAAPGGLKASGQHFHIETIDAGYALPEKGPIVRALQNVYDALALDWQVGEFRSHSDANQLWAAGIKPIVLGPGRLENAHAYDESVSFSQVCRAAQIYLGVMEELLHSSHTN